MSALDQVIEKLRAAPPEVVEEVRRLMERLEAEKVTEKRDQDLFDKYFGVLRGHPAFEGDPVEIQRKLRDEWP